jgi:flagellar basal-body rod protein FlgG
MVNGLHTASRGMMNILAKQDVSAHNLANANTHGFKRSQLATYVEAGAARNDERKLVPNERQTLSEVYTDFTQGPLVGTHGSFDAALSGPGFFTVEGPEGPAYTRNGSFAINGRRELVTLTGQRVLDEMLRPIVLQGDSFQMREDGSFFVDGMRQGRLGLVDFPGEGARKLLAGGDGYYRNPDPAGNPAMKARNCELKQGFLEGSNVDTVSAMVAMVVHTRNYEADMKAVQAIDQTLGKAVNEVGRVG